jgi:hypothetical protein
MQIVVGTYLPRVILILLSDFRLVFQIVSFKYFHAKIVHKNYFEIGGVEVKIFGITYRKFVFFFLTCQVTKLPPP